jgi:TPR repeat protein
MDEKKILPFEEMSEAYRQDVGGKLDRLSPVASDIHRHLSALCTSDEYIISDRFRIKSTNRIAAKDCLDYSGPEAFSTQVKDLFAARLSPSRSDKSKTNRQVKDDLRNTILKYFRDHTDYTLTIECKEKTIGADHLYLIYITFMGHIELQVLTLEESKFLEEDHLAYEMRRLGMSSPTSSADASSVQSRSLSNNASMLVSSSYLSTLYFKCRYNLSKESDDELLSLTGYSYPLAQGFYALVCYWGGPVTVKDKDVANYYVGRAMPLLVRELESPLSPSALVEALYVVGCLKMYGLGTIRDEVKAVGLFRRAAALGFSFAMFQLGLCYGDGTGVTKDLVKRVEYFKKAADLGLASAQYNLGNSYKNGTGITIDLIKANDYFKLAADQGHAAAQYNLGNCYKNGIGVTMDLEKAIEYYRLSADQGHAMAQYNLGNCYKNGSGVSIDPVKAVEYYKLSADQGHAMAQYNLGNCYKNGTGVSTDPIIALECYKLAADHGHTSAQFNMANSFWNGTGVTKDPVMANKYYLLAATEGHVKSQYNLGTSYRDGIGCSKDMEKAKHWLTKAAEQGHEGAINSLKELHK